MKKRIILLTLISIFLGSQLVYAQQNVQAQTKKLSDVNKTLKAKQLEKEKLLKQENIYKRELKNLNDSIARTENHLKKIATDIKVAESNLKKASAQYNEAFKKSSDWNKAMLDELELFNKMNAATYYEADPVEYKIRTEALKDKKNNFDKEKKTADVSASAIKKWESAKKELLELRKKENRLAEEKRNLIKEKNAILKTTAGKRAAAEAEIKELNESAKELQALIKKLSASSGKTTTITAASNKNLRKKSLPWPVEGKIVLNYGKNKHPELDTYVISNGIKIKAANSAQVRSVDTGTVVFTGKFRSYGNVIIIDHKDSYSIYGQLNQILVSEDQKVVRSAVIATLGKNDESVLYFEIRKDNVPDNPLLWLRGK